MAPARTCMVRKRRRQVRCAGSVVHGPAARRAADVCDFPHVCLRGGDGRVRLRPWSPHGCPISRHDSFGPGQDEELDGGFT